MTNERVENIQSELEKNKINALFVSSPVNIQYLTGYSNFSRDEREAYLFVTKRSAALFTDSRYIEAVNKIIPKNIKATIEKPVSKEINRIIKRQKIKNVGFESDLTYLEYKKFRSEIIAKFSLKENFIENLRQIKDETEIKKIKKACKLTDDAYSYVLKNIRMNMTEKELAWRIESYIKNRGSSVSFPTIIAFGPNASIPHHITSNKKLAKGDEFIKIDFGAIVGGYCSDMTRTLLTKKSTSRAKKVYETVLTAQKKALEYLKQKNPNGKKAYDIASKYIVSQGFNSIPHSLGHGIGIQVHELPHLAKGVNEPLSDGMVFSVEPGIYIPNFGGVRIEDDVLLTDDGFEILTKSPKELTVIK